MKTLFSRFAILAVVGSLLAGALMAGCGGGGDTDNTAGNTAASGSPGASGSASASGSGSPAASASSKS